MTRRQSGSDEPRKITITTGDEPPQKNNTLLALLRDGERARPGEPGTLADRLGNEVQNFLAEQMRVARHRRTAVSGTVTITIKSVVGPDGSHAYDVAMSVKTAKIPPGSSLCFIDEDGDITGRPVEPLIEEMTRRERAANTNPAEPKVGTPSRM